MQVHSQVYINAKLRNLEKAGGQVVSVLFSTKEGGEWNEMKWKTWQQENVTLKKQSNLTQNEFINVARYEINGLPPKDKEDFYRLWKASSYVIFSASKKIPSFGENPCFFPQWSPHPTSTGTGRFNRSWCSSLNRTTAWTELFIKNFFFWWSTIFLHLNLPTKIPSKKYMQFQRPPTLPYSSTETSPGDTWTHSLITNFHSFNHRQYESNYHKHDLEITTSKVSHCLLQLQTQS